jgi:hypothetical protein
MKVVAKRIELGPLTNKFAKRSCVGILRNEHTPSTPFDQKLIYCGRFVPFHYYTKVSAKWAELVPLMHKFSKRSCVGIFRNERTRSTPLNPKLMYCGRFELFRYCTKVGAKWAEQVPLPHKFAQ